MEGDLLDGRADVAVGGGCDADGDVDGCDEGEWDPDSTVAITIAVGAGVGVSVVVVIVTGSLVRHPGREEGFVVGFFTGRVYRVVLELVVDSGGCVWML